MESMLWKNFHSNFSSGFHSLLENEDLVDVTIAVEGGYLKAHKTVLSVCSSYFKELFRVNPCKHPIVILQDVSYNILENLLQFMYLGEVTVCSEEMPTFRRVAEILQINELISNIHTDKNDASSGCYNTDTEPLYNEEKPKQKLKRGRPAKKSKAYCATLKLTKKDTKSICHDLQTIPNKVCKEDIYSFDQHIELLEHPIIFKEEPMFEESYECRDSNLSSEIDNSFQPLDPLASMSQETKQVLRNSASSDIIMPSRSGRRRCQRCDRRKNRMTKYYCKICNSYLCLEHVVAVCQECYDKYRI